MNLTLLGQAAKQAAFHLATLTTEQKNQALAVMADELMAQMPAILEANAKDISAARDAGLTDALIDRLYLDEKRLQDIASDVRNVINLADPVGQEFDAKQLQNGLSLVRRRVPLGVVGVIYEARPNVTIDIASLCLKTGNASILRGGKETRHTNKVLIDVVQNALQKANLPSASVQAIDDPDRALVNQLLKLDQYVDMIIPRGGQSLHQMCKEHSTIPVIIGGFGISHIFVDECAKIEPSIEVIDNAKCQRPSACNSLDTLLVHKNIAVQFLPKLIEKWQGKVEFVVDANAQTYFADVPHRLAQAGDFDTEWLSYSCGIKLVDDIDQAIAHMQAHNASHSDAIMTQNSDHAARFVQSAGSAAVYVNASTRFTDGAQFGLGAEVAVSTQKLHARGPMGLEELTSYQWVGTGDYLPRG